MTSSQAHSDVLAIVAGNGVLPRACAESARRSGSRVIIIAHRGETDQKIGEVADVVEWISVGQLGRILSHIRTHRATRVVFAGGISRLKLFGALKLDLKALSLVARLRSVRDDVLLRGVAAEVEATGAQVISASTLLTDWIPGPGLLTVRGLSARQVHDCQVGWEVADLVGRADVGQSVVVKEGVVVAVEAVEGTDRTIRRAGELAGPGSVIVKRCKPQQDLRLDLPTVGVETLRSMQAAGAQVLALEAGRSIILQPGEFVQEANRLGLTVLSVSSDAQLADFVTNN